MRKRKGFSLIELLIAVAIILTIAAIAIPNMIRARMSANEASAVGSLRTITSAMIMFQSSYPATGYPASLGVLGSTPCHPNATSPCLLDGTLAGGSKSGYNFAATSSGGPPTTSYYATAVPISLNHTGVTSFCTCEDGVIRYDPSGALPGSAAACQNLSPLPGQSAGSGGGGSGSGSGGGSSGGSGGGSSGGSGGGSSGGGGGGSSGGSGGSGNGGGNGNGNNGNGNGNGGGNGSNGGGNGNGNNGNGNGNGGGNGSSGGGNGNGNSGSGNGNGGGED